MRRVYFKTDTSGPVRFFCTPEGKIDFSELGQKFKLDPTSIDLNGDRFPKAGLDSRDEWEKIEEAFKEDGLPVGTKEDPVIVTGEAPVPTEGPPSKKLKPRTEAPARVEEFVQSAGRNFLAYQQKNSVPGDSQEKFLAVCGDLLGTLPSKEGCLIWIRKFYKDMMRILVKADEYARFIFRGTSGVGKSMFTLVWISYLAAQRKKVVFKSNSDAFYLLDFSLEEAKAFGPFQHVHVSDLQDVLNDSTAWLILDGRQPKALEFSCHMLLACSNKKANYHEFAKNPYCSDKFVPVWNEEEVEEFLVDFEPHRSVYGHMSVPDEGTVMKNFRLFGGVPRCVFTKSDSEERSLREAIRKLNTDACLTLFESSFVCDDADRLVHMKQGNDTYSDYQFDFASQCVLEKVWQQLQLSTKHVTVHYMEHLLRSSTTGAAFGSMFELVAHFLVAQGGKFKMKKVSKDGKPEAIADLVLKESNRKVFEELSDLRNFQDGDYCQPKKTNLPSVDAVILPNMLLQFFHYTRGNHGYKIKGLQDVDDVLKKPRYCLISCVPEDTYDSSGFQNFLDGNGKVTRGYKELLEKMDQYVVMVDFKRYSKLGGENLRENQAKRLKHADTREVDVGEGKPPLNKSKLSLELSEALLQVLGEKYPDSGVEDDDIIKLVAAGFSTAAALAAATKEDLDSVFPGRPGVVQVLLRAFVQPAVRIGAFALCLSQSSS